jgi:hypothetical protein
MPCLPGISTIALFVAIVLLDLYGRDWARIPGHALFGVFATLLVLFICERAGEGPAWLLLGAPFIFVFIGWLSRVAYSGSSSTESTPTIYDNDSCECCGQMPCQCRHPCQRPRPMPKPQPCDCPSCPPCPKQKNCKDKDTPKKDSCIPNSLA